MIAIVKVSLMFCRLTIAHAWSLHWSWLYTSTTKIRKFSCKRLMSSMEIWWRLHWSGTSVFLEWRNAYMELSILFTFLLFCLYSSWTNCLACLENCFDWMCFAFWTGVFWPVCAHLLTCFQFCCFTQLWTSYFGMLCPIKTACVF